MDELHPDLERARFGNKRGDQDKFLAFWLMLLVETRQRSGRRGMRRAVARFLESRDVAQAYESAGTHAVEEQLTDAARVYFESCLTDTRYSSAMFGFGQLKPEAVRRKIAEDTAALLANLSQAAPDGHAAALPKIFVDGYLQAMAPGGPHELREAIEKHPDSASVIETLLQE